MDMQITFTYRKNTFRDNHMFVLHYLIDICVYAKFSTLCINQLYTCRKNFDVDCVIFKITFKFKIERGMHPNQFPHPLGDCMI